MKDRLVIRLPQVQLELSTPVEWVVFDSLGHSIDHGCTGIDQLSAQITTLSDTIDTTVIVPAESVLLTQISIPSKQMRQIKQALPFMVEELIAEDIEDVHIAIPGQLDLSQDTIDVAVVQHALLINWLDILLSHGLSPDCIAVDALCLPGDHLVHQNSWTLLVDNERLLIRTGGYAGMAIVVDDSELIIAGLMEEGNSPAHSVRPSLTIISSAAQQSDQATCARLALYLRDNFPDHEVKERFYQEGITDIMSNAWLNQPTKGINLLQGGYSVAGSDVNTWQHWKLAASVAAISIISYLVLTVGSGWYFSSQAEKFEQQSFTLYKQLFPNERRIVSPKKQMQNHLRLTGAANNTAFLALLAETAKHLGNRNSDLPVSVKQLRFDSERGDLQFEVQSQSLDQLDQLKQLLANAGLQVDINSATEQGNVVMGRIVVRNL